MEKANSNTFYYALPVRPHLKAFISKFTDVEPYVLTKKDVFGTIILHELEKSVYQDKKYKFKHEILNVEIQDNLLARKGGYSVSARTIVGINSYLRELFYFTLLQFVRLKLIENNDYTIITCVREFYKEYHLNEDLINSHTVLKHLQRYL